MPAEEAGLASTVIAGLIAGGLVTTAVAWIARCGVQFQRLARDVDDRLVAYVDNQTARKGEALALILSAAIPEVFDLYFRRHTPDDGLGIADLRRAVAAMEEEEELANFRRKELVTRPSVDHALNAIGPHLEDLASQVANQPAVMRSVMRVRSVFGEARATTRRASVMAWRFGIQAVALIVALAVALAAATEVIRWDVASVVTAIVVVHGVSAEVSLHRLHGDLQVLPDLLGPEL